ncbi:MAG: hypothetical protein GXP05_07770 [Alphaproteobacteria bacterium]|nr:hypothetical protein [Alphaproteobacteria bacterium]
MKRLLIGFVLFVFAASFGSTTLAQTALTIRSKALGKELALTLTQLRDMSQETVVTGNEFVDGKRVFRGPLMRDVMQCFSSVLPKTVILTAANDFQSEAPVEEFFKYNVILALSVDGVALSMRDKGPLWMIYPMSDFPELRDPIYNSRLIWQLISIDYQ